MSGYWQLAKSDVGLDGPAPPETPSLAGSIVFFSIALGANTSALLSAAGRLG